MVAIAVTDLRSVENKRFLGDKCFKKWDYSDHHVTRAAEVEQGLLHRVR